MSPIIRWFPTKKPLFYHLFGLNIFFFFIRIIIQNISRHPIIKYFLYFVSTVENSFAAFSEALLFDHHEPKFYLMFLFTNSLVPSLIETFYSLFNSNKSDNSTKETTKTNEATKLLSNNFFNQNFFIKQFSFLIVTLMSIPFLKILGEFFLENIFFVEKHFCSLQLNSEIFEKHLLLVFLIEIFGIFIPHNLKIKTKSFQNYSVVVFESIYKILFTSFFFILDLPLFQLHLNLYKSLIFSTTCHFFDALPLRLVYIIANLGAQLLLILNLQISSASKSLDNYFLLACNIDSSNNVDFKLVTEKDKEINNGIAKSSSEEAKESNENFDFNECFVLKDEKNKKKLGCGNCNNNFDQNYYVKNLRKRLDGSKVKINNSNHEQNKNLAFDKIIERLNRERSKEEQTEEQEKVIKHKMKNILDKYKKRNCLNKSLALKYGYGYGFDYGDNNEKIEEEREDEKDEEYKENEDSLYNKNEKGDFLINNEELYFSNNRNFNSNRYSLNLNNHHKNVYSDCDYIKIKTLNNLKHENDFDGEKKKRKKKLKVEIKKENNLRKDKIDLYSNYNKSQKKLKKKNIDQNLFFEDGNILKNKSIVLTRENSKELLFYKNENEGRIRRMEKIEKIISKNDTNEDKVLTENKNLWMNTKTPITRISDMIKDTDYYDHHNDYDYKKLNSKESFIVINRKNIKTKNKYLDNKNMNKDSTSIVEPLKNNIKKNNTDNMTNNNTRANNHLSFHEFFNKNHYSDNKIYEDAICRSKLQNPSSSLCNKNEFAINNNNNVELNSGQNLKEEKINDKTQMIIKENNPNEKLLKQNHSIGDDNRSFENNIKNNQINTKSNTPFLEVKEPKTYEKEKNKQNQNIFYQNKRDQQKNEINENKINTKHQNSIVTDFKENSEYLNGFSSNQQNYKDFDELKLVTLKNNNVENEKIKNIFKDKKTENSTNIIDSVLNKKINQKLDIELENEKKKKKKLENKKQNQIQSSKKENESEANERKEFVENDFYSAKDGTKNEIKEKNIIQYDQSYFQKKKLLTFIKNTINEY